jgi:hypothetical protein
VAGATVNLTGTRAFTRVTDAAGAFSFAGLPVGGAYLVTPSLAGHVFTPRNLRFTNLQSNQGAANFTATGASAISQVSGGERPPDDAGDRDGSAQTGLRS